MVWPLQATILLTFTISFIGPLPVFAESVDSKIQDGIAQYHEGNFKEAGKNFASASTDRPDDTRLGYNLGNSYYKGENFPEALKAFTHSSLNEKDPNIIKNSIYNTGNTLVKMGKLEEAETAYKKVLSLDASDMDAKYNLEYVRQELKKKEEEEEKGSDPDKKNNKDSDKDSNSEKQKGENQESNQEQDQDQNGEGEQPEDNPPPPPENAENAEPEENNQETPAQAGESTMEVSQEEAERMLNGLTEDLKSISRMQAGKTKSAYQGNDW
jgi:Ca-activated chloride channel homolog